MRLTSFTVTAIFFATLLAAPLLSAQSPGAALSQEQLQQLQVLQQENQQLQQQIGQIQQQAVEQNPDLLEQNEKLQEMILESMVAGGFDPEADMRKMDELRAEYTQPETTEQRKVALQQEAQQITTRLEQAEERAIADPKVQAAGTKLEEELIATMSRIDPNFSKLMEQLTANQEKMRQVMGLVAP